MAVRGVGVCVDPMGRADTHCAWASKTVVRAGVQGRSSLRSAVPALFFHVARGCY
jgi:hypothetical protein